MKLLSLLLLVLLPSCSTLDGLAVSYSKSIGGQTLTGFYGPDGYGLVGKPTGKQPVVTASK